MSINQYTMRKLNNAGHYYRSGSKYKMNAVADMFQIDRFMFSEYISLLNDPKLREKMKNINIFYNSNSSIKISDAAVRFGVSDIALVLYRFMDKNKIFDNSLLVSNTLQKPDTLPKSLENTKAVTNQPTKDTVATSSEAYETYKSYHKIFSISQIATIFKISESALYIQVRKDSSIPSNNQQTTQLERNALSAFFTESRGSSVQKISKSFNIPVERLNYLIRRDRDRMVALQEIVNLFPQLYLHLKKTTLKYISDKYFKLQNPETVQVEPVSIAPKKITKTKRVTKHSKVVNPPFSKDELLKRMTEANDFYEISWHKYTLAQAAKKFGLTESQLGSWRFKNRKRMGVPTDGQDTNQSIQNNLTTHPDTTTRTNKEFVELLVSKLGKFLTMIMNS